MEKTKKEFKKNIELIGILQHPDNDSWGPEDYPVAGAMGCFAEESSTEIHKKHAIASKPYTIGKGSNKKQIGWKQTKELIMKETSGRGHGAVLDHGVFEWSIDNLTRGSTLTLCSPQYASHLQQSLRRATAERSFNKINSDSEMGKRGFTKITSDQGNEIMAKQFELYNEMVKGGIPTEDARIILPLNTKTTIHTLWDARELMHLKSMAERMRMPSEVNETINEMYEQARKVAPSLMKERDKNFEVLAWMPSNQLYSRDNLPLEIEISKREANKNNPNHKFLLDYSIGLRMSDKEISKAIHSRDEALLSNLKHTHFSFMVPMSLMSFHQATRQRTWDQSVEPLEQALQRGVFVIPPSIKNTEYSQPLTKLSKESRRYALRNLNKTPEVLGVIPHNLEIYDLIHINGWNALHSIGKRTCKTAQWEIRSKANIIAKEIRQVYSALGKYCLPQGMLYGSCPERENCGMCKTGEYKLK